MPGAISKSNEAQKFARSDEALCWEQFLGAMRLYVHIIARSNEPL